MISSSGSFRSSPPWRCSSRSWSSPSQAFTTQAPPPDGAGMTPSLQNPYMLAHPPLLYLGYVGLTVPFAFALGALLSGQLDERWLVATRRWTLLAWAASASGSSSAPIGRTSRSGGVATTPGPRRERRAHALAGCRLPPLGDDPGEARNAPGLERSPRHPRVPLSLFGTFLTRSGVVNSIHSFTRARSGRGSWASSALRSPYRFGLVFWQLPQLRSPTRLGLRSLGGGVPLQQSAPSRALPGDPLGCRARCFQRQFGASSRARSLVLRLLPCVSLQSFCC